jgi:metal-dependent amidase/aminoacylase/carboxypeptidase family protein
MHVTWFAGATKLLAEARTTWRGTLMAVFQPGEETAEGAQAMIDNGLFKRFAKPDVVLGQHVMVGPSGTVAGRAGAITSAADAAKVGQFGSPEHSLAQVWRSEKRKWISRPRRIEREFSGFGRKSLAREDSDYLAS